MKLRTKERWERLAGFAFCRHNAAKDKPAIHFWPRAIHFWHRMETRAYTAMETSGLSEARLLAQRLIWAEEIEAGYRADGDWKAAAEQEPIVDALRERVLSAAKAMVAW